ncbi:hypothetical protein [Cytobacillus sp.]|uniref:hypothetical protein n=1 Tax=Cytobacillus sp. TaxID=2675269 RepID=UPI0028BD3CD6|nr:hypothetical protein [Cytobacillus sp.]
MMFLLVIEIIFGALVIFPFYSLQGMKVPLLSYFIVLLISCLLFLFLLQRFKEKGKMLFFVLLFPIIIIGGYGLNFPVLFSLLVSFFVFWRTISHVNEQDKQNEGKWILFTILLGIFVIFFSGISSPANMTTISVLMIAQVLFIIIGGFIRRWLSLDIEIKNKKQFILPFLSILLFIGIVGSLLTIGMNAIRGLFFSFLHIGVNIIAFITKPFFNWAESQDWSEQIEKLTSSQDSDESSVAQKELMELEQNVFLDPTIIATIIIIATLLFFFLYIYKRKRKDIGEEQKMNVPGFSTERSILNDSTAFFRRTKTTPPKNPIRKEIYAFERFAKKMGLGRWPFESLPEWLLRMGINHSSDIITIYEKVRYGENHLTRIEETYFKEEIDKTKQQLKTMKKINKHV